MKTYAGSYHIGGCLDHTARVGSLGEQANLLPLSGMEYTTSVVHTVVLFTTLTTLFRHLHHSRRVIVLVYPTLRSLYPNNYRKILKQITFFRTANHPFCCFWGF